MEIIAKLSDFGSLATIGLAIYLFFKDPMRRWAFFGYKPTAMIIFYDHNTKKSLIIQPSHRNTWHFPQGGIYSNQINQVVDEILLREIAVPRDMYKFVKTIPLGVVKRTNWTYTEKYYTGAISMFPNTQGKSYLACIILTDLNKIKNKIKLGYGINKYQILPMSKCIQTIDPEKAKLIRKILPELSQLQ